MPDTLVHVGENLRRLRILNALTQAQLAERAGITESAVARAERDETEPHMTTVRKLADALGVHPRELIERSDDAKH
jgi:transcriptional regulator with XRE-family HTH domain